MENAGASGHCHEVFKQYGNKTYVKGYTVMFLAKPELAVGNAISTIVCVIEVFMGRSLGKIEACQLVNVYLYRWHISYNASKCFRKLSPEIQISMLCAKAWCIPIKHPFESEIINRKVSVKLEEFIISYSSRKLAWDTWTWKLCFAWAAYMNSRQN